MNKKIVIIMLGIVTLQLILLVGIGSALIIDNVNSMPNEIAPGEDAEISIELENERDDDIEEVSVSLLFKDVKVDSTGRIVEVIDLPFAPYDSSSEVSFEEIRSDKSKTARFFIQALGNAEAGVYKIPVEITYTENDEIKTKSSLISLTVNSKPLLSLEKADELYLKGQNNEVSIKIINKGLSDVKFLTANLGASTKYNLLSSNSIYIGDLDSDDFDSAEFKIFFKESSAETMTLPITLEYRDVLNNKHVEEFSLSVKAYSSEQAIKLGLMKKSNVGKIIGGLVIVIILYFIYRKIKKRKKKL